MVIIIILKTLINSSNYIVISWRRSMRSNWHRALLVSFVLIMSSLAGCIGTDNEDELEEGQYGTVMVSTYHVGEIVKAIAGDTVNIQMMSQDNIPVHDLSLIHI